MSQLTPWQLEQPAASLPQAKGTHVPDKSPTDIASQSRPSPPPLPTPGPPLHDTNSLPSRHHHPTPRIPPYRHTQAVSSPSPITRGGRKRRVLLTTQDEIALLRIGVFLRPEYRHRRKGDFSQRLREEFRAYSSKDLVQPLQKLSNIVMKRRRILAEAVNGNVISQPEWDKAADAWIACEDELALSDAERRERDTQEATDRQMAITHRDWLMKSVNEAQAREAQERRQFRQASARREQGAEQEQDGEDQEDIPLIPVSASPTIPTSSASVPPINEETRSTSSEQPGGVLENSLARMVTTVTRYYDDRSTAHATSRQLDQKLETVQDLADLSQTLKEVQSSVDEMRTKLATFEKVSSEILQFLVEMKASKE